MDSLRSTKVRRVRYAAVAAGLGLIVLFGGACSFLLDRSTTQCQTDSDCLSFGVHPSCQSGVCVDTGIPCFEGVPDSSVEFLNQCSTGECLQFDNCSRLGVCGDDGPSLEQPPPPEAGTADASPYNATALCADLAAGQGSSVYITGSSNFPVLLSNIAPLVFTGAAPLTAGPAIIWLTSSSCQGADAIFSPDAAANVIHDPPKNSAQTSYAQYYLADGGSQPCLLGEAGAPVDIGESDVFSTTCNGSYMITGKNDTLGPIQAMEFVVPALSDQYVISQEAAREVFGLGGNDGGASPWTNPQRYYVRNKNTGTQQMIGLQIGVPAGEFWGIDRGTASNVLSDLQSLASNFQESEQAIGILSDDVYDSDRSNLRALAFQADGQNCAYLADSTSSSFDKQNVRDGHYPIWGPLHFFTSNQPSVQVLSFLNYINGATTTPAIIDAFIDTNLVPNCAMTVLRSENQELSELVSFQPQNSCGCYFLNEVEPTGLPAECTKCETTADCPPSRPACNFGFCEVQ